jgi:hypothetical protein
MSNIVIIATITGVLLGLRFRVPVLALASLLCFAWITAASIVSGADLRTAGAAVTLGLTGLQSGYLVGILLVFAKPRLRAAPGRAAIAAMQRLAR